MSSFLLFNKPFVSDIVCVVVETRLKFSFAWAIGDHTFSVVIDFCFIHNIFGQAIAVECAILLDSTIKGSFLNFCVHQHVGIILFNQVYNDTGTIITGSN